MKKLIFLAVLLFGLVVLSHLSDLSYLSQKRRADGGEDKPILTFALVADSHSENDLLKKALLEAKARNVNFVIGLGDFSTIGTNEELLAAKREFESVDIRYYLTSGDHDLWASRNEGLEPLAKYNQIFGESMHSFDTQNIRFVILDNSDIYSGISDEGWEFLEKVTNVTKEPNEPNDLGTSGSSGSSDTSVSSKLLFVFAHKTPYHPQSDHIMGQDRALVAAQAIKLTGLLEDKKVDGFFSGDLHFFAQYKSPSEAVKITTVGAVASERNFQGPRFAVVSVFSDYSWKVEDVEIK